jgi:hypothetical protein
MGKARPLLANGSTFCCYCKRGPLIPGDAGCSNHTGMTATRDHLVPRHAVGPGKWVPCCLACNQLKGALLPTAWFAFTDENPGYWRSFQTHAQVLRWLLEFNRWRRSQGLRGIPLHRGPVENIGFVINNG